jgi:hypothetical protein
VTFQWREEQFEFHCYSASIETVPCEDTGETIDWLYCKGVQAFNGVVHPTAKPMTLLIPVRLITSVTPGSPFRLSKRRRTIDRGIFPPNVPIPENAMTRQDVLAAITELYVPRVETIVRLCRQKV